jgi:hypothetical protein
MSFFFVVLSLGWIAIGAAIISRINRAEFKAQGDRGQRNKRYQDDSEFRELLRDEGLFALIIMILLTLVIWPAVLYIMIKEDKS